jgi:anthranilate phosphoribosyltransferase
MSALDAFDGWPGVLATLLAGDDLTEAAAAAAMSTILAGEATPAQIAAFVVALRAKGETASELRGLVRAALDASTAVPLTESEQARAIDVVGTGGDGTSSVNVSTMAALVVAGAGVPVCKHGNRSASSRCGTADVLEALGVAIEQSGPGVAACVREAGIGFCLAPAFHPAFRHAGPPRRDLGIPTVFNLIGPMANPGRVRRQLIGVADPRFAGPMIETLRTQGLRAAWIAHGDGFDELTTTGVSHVHELRDDEVRSFTIDARELGLAPATAADLRGGGPDENAEIARRVLGGATGPHRDIVVLNAGAALVVAGRADDVASGIAVAQAAIDDGRAAAALDALVRTSRAQASA